MDNLEEYIKRNAEEFNTAELPEGHLERFIKKMDSPSVLSTGSVTRKTVRRIVWASVAVAAALAGIIFINRPVANDDLIIAGHSKDWFANIGNDEIDICRTYYEKVGEFYEAILTQHPDGSFDESVSNIAEETIPLVDQLPEEMEPDARAAVLKEYYGDLLDGLERIVNIK